VVGLGSVLRGALPSAGTRRRSQRTSTSGCAAELGANCASIRRFSGRAFSPSQTRSLLKFCVSSTGFDAVRRYVIQEARGPRDSNPGEKEPLLKNLTLFTRILAVGLLPVACFSFLVAWLQFRVNDRTYGAKSEKTKQLVDCPGHIVTTGRTLRLASVYVQWNGLADLP
jgi:hypothetical protein